MVEAPWSKSLDIDVDGSWPPGDYLLKLVADDVAQRYVPLTIRDDNSTAALVVQNEVTTWQAYDQWGGYSLYAGGSGPGRFERRARVVSFDRPYSRRRRERLHRLGAAARRRWSSRSASTSPTGPTSTCTRDPSC